MFGDTSDPAQHLGDIRSLSRASSMSTRSRETLDSSVNMVSAIGEETSNLMETQGGGQALNPEEKLKSSLHGIKEFFRFYKLEGTRKGSKFKRKITYKGMAICCKCLKKIKFDSESRGNLKKHFKSKHPSMLSSLEEALSLNRFKPTTKVQMTSRQITLREATERPKLSQEMAQQAYVVWFAEGLKPLCDTEDEATRTFLNFLKPEFKMPCRKTLTKRLNKYAVQVKDEVRATLQDVDLVATTADSWTAHRRAFLGCTAHWIDPITLERKAATLACRELMEKQTGRVLARNLSDIFAEFDISHKITHCTTDNGRNYVAAFEHFAADATTMPELTEEELEEQTDKAIVNSEVVDVSDMLHNRGYDDESQLPLHFKCSAHTLNLLATTDVAKVPEWNTGSKAVFSRPGVKAQTLWNLQNSSSVYADKIKEALGGRRLVTPVATRWNSYFKSMKALIELVLENQDAKVAINRILADHGFAGFDLKDAEVVKEYVDVMEPVATCLDRMQSDKWTYMGNLLPELMLLKKKLQEQQSRNLKYANKLVDYLLDQDNFTNGFANRFGHLFTEENLLMATATHPAHTLQAISCLAEQDCTTIKERLVRELVDIISETPALKAAADQDCDQYFCYDDLYGPSTSTTPANNSTLEEVIKMEVTTPDNSSTLEEVIKVEVINWVRTRDHVVRKEQFPVGHRDAWVKLFVKYNTSLPSSAAADRLFSTAGNILRPKMSSLTANNFEQLVMLKGNSEKFKTFLKKDLKEGADTDLE